MQRFQNVLSLEGTYIGCDVDINYNQRRTMHKVNTISRVEKTSATKRTKET
jgi:hypothetical protein